MISSQKNPMSFPLLVEFGNEIYVTPTRLKIAKRHKNVNYRDQLSEVTESPMCNNKFTQEIIFHSLL